MPGGFRESLPQDGNGKHDNGKHGMLGGFGACRTWMALVRLQGIAFPAPRAGGGDDLDAGYPLQHES